MAARAGRGDRQNRVDRTLWIDDAFFPSGRFCSLPSTWHMAQLRRSPGEPLGLIAG